jgi:integrase
MAYIRKRNGRYEAQVRRVGYPAVSKSFSSKTVAKKWIKAVETDMERGEFNPRIDLTVGQLIKRYQTEVVPQHKARRSTTVRCQMLRRMLGSVQLSQLTPAVLASYRDERLKVIKPNTLKHDLSVLSSVINTARIDWGIPIPLNPVQFVRVPKFDDKRDRRLKLGEEQKLLDHASPICQRLIIIAIETAMRRGEILRIRKSHVDFGNQTLLIPETKTDKPRTIPVSTRAIKALRDQIKPISDANVVQMEHDPLVFDIRSREFSYAVDKIRTKLNMDDWRFHDLRHEATSRLFEKGLNMMEVASITGHEDLKMLKRYTHIRPETLVERLG